MIVLVTGVCGQVGSDVMRELNRRGIECIGSDIQAEWTGFSDEQAALDMPVATSVEKAPSGESTMPYIPLDITDRDEVRKTVGEVCPDAIIHCAARTDVDGADDPENRPLVQRINFEGTRRRRMQRCSISPRTMSLTAGAKSIGIRMTKAT